MPNTDVISFSRGAPSLDIVDTEGLKAAAVAALDADPARVTGYGTSVGYPLLREWIAAKHNVAIENVLVTNGSMQADAFLFDELVAPGSPVIVERPTYDRTLLGLRNRRGELHPVTIQADGLNVDELEGILKGGVRPTLAHIIPNFQNPAGVTLSGDKRRRLLALADEYDFMIFEDDPYYDIRFRGEQLPTMLSQTDLSKGASGRVAYACSFSKTVCPGLRTGYLVGPADLIKKIATAATNTYIAPNMFAQATIYQFAASGALDKSIATVKGALEERVDQLSASLRAHLPGAEFVVPDGGYFLWVDLGEGVDCAKVAAAAADEGVQVVKGTDFVIEGGESCLRLAYSAVHADRIDEGVRRLAKAVEATRA
ncbi:PLP-dependent aminotransferase family protein [Glycomyces buryatensis]|uniref:PLP-dependent aminotransferase family protein n=1 Tax=Glycomyces buryatensis TaxID=2570927 RepID=A0A4S8QBE9_9ACTN|nr:PLP-dependent aminotransferase family protein [Glycomyces buryatensis]THV41600.1 PLP-dependent aminotransferase family protein [Glycomyces buryatensis]